MVEQIGKDKKIPLSRIRQGVMVREMQSEDRIDYFLRLLEAGQKLKPLWITQDGKIIDGRTRMTAYTRRGVDEVDVIVHPEILTNEQITALALESNYGGPLPPSNGDIEYIIKQLVKDGKTSKQIITLLPFLPPRLISISFGNVTERMMDEKVSLAVKDILESKMTLKEAVTEYGVTESRLQTALGRTEKKLKRTSSQEVGQVTGTISQVQKRLTHNVNYQGKKLVTLASDDLLTDKDYATLEKYVENQKRIINDVYDNWLLRVKIAGKKSAEGAQPSKIRKKKNNK